MEIVLKSPLHVEASVLNLILFIFGVCIFVFSLLLLFTFKNLSIYGFSISLFFLIGAFINFPKKPTKRFVYP